LQALDRYIGQPRARWPKFEFVGLEALHSEILGAPAASHNTNNRRKLHDIGMGESAIRASLLAPHDGS